MFPDKIKQLPCFKKQTLLLEPGTIPNTRADPGRPGQQTEAAGPLLALAALGYSWSSAALQWQLVTGYGSNKVPLIGHA